LLVAFLKIESTWVLTGFLILLCFLFWVAKKFENLGETTNRHFTEHRIFAVVFGLMLAFVIPFFFRANPYAIHILIMSGLATIMSLGLNLQIAGAGLPNLGFGAFYGIGAYTSALLSVHYGIPFFACIVAGGGMAVLLSFFSGILVLRTTHAYFALITMSLGMIFYLLVVNLEWTGGPNGIANIPPPSVGGFALTSPLPLMGTELPMQTNFFYLLLVFMMGTFLIFSRLHQSRFGLNLNSIREDELAASCFGIDHVRAKLSCYCLSSFFAGIAGVFYAHFVSFIHPSNFSIHLSFVTLSMVILGGMNNLLGVTLGAVALTLIPEKFRAFQDYRLVLYAAVVIFMLLFRPKGLLPEKVRRYRRKVNEVW